MILSLVMALGMVMPVQESPLEAWRDYLASGAPALSGWIRAETLRQMGMDVDPVPFPSGIPAWYGTLGVFVTLRTGRDTRGCYGAFYHSSADPARMLSDYIGGALRRDSRYRSPEPWEADRLEIVLTITDFPRSSHGPGDIDTRRSGVIIQFENDEMPSMVLVPGEVADNGRLAELAGGRPCQFLTFNAVTLRVKP